MNRTLIIDELEFPCVWECESCLLRFKCYTTTDPIKVDLSELQQLVETRKGLDMRRLSNGDRRVRGDFKKV